MKDALEMMERCHLRLAEESARLCASPDDEAEESLAFFSRTLRRHFADEEESLFPRLGPEHAELVRDLTADHRRHEALLAAMEAAQQTGEPLAPLAARFRDALAVHAAREDRELLPLVVALAPEARRQLSEEMQARRGGGDGRGRRRR